MKTKTEATQLANLLSNCLGAGWKPRVWENLGWHYCAEYKEGYLTVFPTLNNKFYAMLSGSNHTNCGYYNWTDDKTFKNPRQAVKHTLKLVKNHIDFLNQRYDDVEKSVN